MRTECLLFVLASLLIESADDLEADKKKNHPASEPRVRRSEETFRRTPSLCFSEEEEGFI